MWHHVQKWESISRWLMASGFVMVLMCLVIIGLYSRNEMTPTQFYASFSPIVFCVMVCCCGAQLGQCRAKCLLERERVKAEEYTDFEMTPLTITILSCKKSFCTHKKTFFFTMVRNL